MGFFSKDKDIICKCKGIKESEIINAIKNNIDTYEKLKSLTGAGDGRCKGLRCKKKIEKLIEENKQ